MRNPNSFGTRDTEYNETDTAGQTPKKGLRNKILYVLGGLALTSALVGVYANEKGLIPGWGNRETESEDAAGSLVDAAVSLLNNAPSAAEEAPVAEGSTGEEADESKNDTMEEVDPEMKVIASADDTPAQAQKAETSGGVSIKATLSLEVTTSPSAAPETKAPMVVYGTPRRSEGDLKNAPLRDENGNIVLDCPSGMEIDRSTVFQIQCKKIATVLEGKAE